jgi:hypothetical protein
MSFLKSLVKEVNVAKSMINIPLLKEERDKLQSDLDKCLAEIEKVTAIETPNICETATNFQKYSKHLNHEDQELAKQLSEKLQQYVNNSQIKLSEFLKKKDALQEKIASINDKLKKARSDVK